MKKLSVAIKRAYRDQKVVEALQRDIRTAYPLPAGKELTCDLLSLKLGAVIIKVDDTSVDTASLMLFIRTRMEIELVNDITDIRIELASTGGEMEERPLIEQLWDFYSSHEKANLYAFVDWLAAPNTDLGYKSPNDLLGTPQEELLVDIIGRWVHGVPS